MAGIPKRAKPKFKLQYYTSVFNICPVSATSFVIGLVVLPNNLKPVLGLAKGIILCQEGKMTKYLKVVLNMVDGRGGKVLDTYLGKNFRRQMVFQDHVILLKYLTMK